MTAKGLLRDAGQRSSLSRRMQTAGQRPTLDAQENVGLARGSGRRLLSSRTVAEKGGVVTDVAAALTNASKPFH